MTPKIQRSAVVLVAVACLASSGCGRRAYSGAAADPDIVAKIRKDLESGAPATVAADEGPVGAGWADLKGRFTFEGTPPDLQPLNVDKDTEFCAKGGHVVLDRSLLVDKASGGVANVVIYARTVRRVHEDAKQPPKEPSVFDQVKCDFVDRVVAFHRGLPLEVKNSDSISHNTNLQMQTAEKENALIPGNSSIMFTATAQESEPAKVSCNIHPWMQAFVFPRNNLYFAVTKADGSFEIKNLPAGEKVELQLWHERGASGKNALMVEALQTQTNGKFTVTLEDGKPKDLGELKLSAASFK